VPQHDPRPWVAATAKATPVPGEPDAANWPLEQPDAQAPQTPGDTVSATLNRSVWVTRRARQQAASALPAGAVRATTANMRPSLLSIAAGSWEPKATFRPSDRACRGGDVVNQPPRPRN
jgi:hypothetical protein